MAVDYQICYPQQAIRVNAIYGIEGSKPAAIKVYGDDFSSIDEVYVNDELAPSYTIVSLTEMTIVLPSTISAEEVNSVAVLSRRLMITPKSLIRFRVPKTPSKVVGILRLCQLFLKILFTTQGKDIFNPRLGGGALRNVGRNISREQTGSILSDFVVSVNNTQRQIIAAQGRQPQLPADERLLTARVLSANFNAQDAALYVSVELISQAGNSALANVMV
jgi:hypothetical protein